MKIVIVEDEFMVAKRLKRFVNTIYSEQSIHIQLFNTLDDATDHLADNPIDLLFLDLNLQGQDGFELLKQQVSRSFHTVVVSANTNRAIEAFEIGVLDFIAKPFSLERVQKAIDRLRPESGRGQSHYLSYKHLGKVELLPIKDVIYLKAAGHYTEVITLSGDVILHDKNLDKLLLVLPATFERIHRSYAVPVSAMQSIKSEAGSKYWLTLINGDVLPIGRTKIKAIREKMI